MLRFTALASLAVILAVVGVAGADHHEEGEEWTNLLSSDSLEAWKGYKQKGSPKGWVVEDGVLVNKSSNVDLITKEKYGDFELRFDWKISKGGNSGVIYLCDESEGASYMTGPEFQLLDNKGWGNDDFDPHSTAALYALYPVTDAKAKPAGEWNASRIVVRNGKVEHWLNGAQVVSAEIGGGDWKKRVAESKFNAWKRFGTLKSGQIALQAHAGKDGAIDPTWFRNVKVRRLDQHD